MYSSSLSEQLRQPPVVFDDAVGRASFISKPAGFSYVAQQCRKACLAREAVRVGRTWLSTLEVRDGLGPQRVAPERLPPYNLPTLTKFRITEPNKRGLVLLIRTARECMQKNPEGEHPNFPFAPRAGGH